eukprot:1160442-Pelagomonas_calceolata.AAC.18
MGCEDSQCKSQPAAAGCILGFYATFCVTKGLLHIQFPFSDLDNMGMDHTVLHSSKASTSALPFQDKDGARKQAWAPCPFNSPMNALPQLVYKKHLCVGHACVQLAKGQAGSRLPQDPSSFGKEKCVRATGPLLLQQAKH